MASGLAAGLRSLIEGELDRDPGPRARAMAEKLAARPGVAAVLFYGAQMRDEAAGGGGGPLDFYLLTDSNIAYHGAGLSAAANYLLPPNVYYERIDESPPIEAKVAVATLAAFRARMRPDALDTTFWARFAQPVILVWSRGPAEREAVVDAVSTAVETAAWWGSRFAPAEADTEAFWSALFTHTYGSELRVESGGRVQQLMAAAPGRYQRIHEWLAEAVDQPERRRAATAWRRRAALGKFRNLARLTKAAFTYRGGFAYALSKVERHSGKAVELAPWQRRWPWLAAPFVLWRLWREKRLK
ncbi:MAG: hypothetical protein OEN23_11090 [Paracoccaceae bacterium]|nr:hypothetical protein [Paracoccaceae bacterium]